MLATQLTGTRALRHSEETNRRDSGSVCCGEFSGDLEDYASVRSQMDMMDLLNSDPLSRNAQISLCGTYRYKLTRSWGSGPSLTFIMFNPSTADGLRDDQTIRRCMYFAKREGYSGITVVNLYAYRTTFPVDLVARFVEGVDVVGPRNQRSILESLNDARQVVLAWGGMSFKGLSGHPQVIRECISSIPDGIEILCLGTTKDGAPRHPSRLGNDVALVPYKLA